MERHQKPQENTKGIPGEIRTGAQLNVLLLVYSETFN